jgi:hypothetical protein
MYNHKFNFRVQILSRGDWLSAYADKDFLQSTSKNAFRLIISNQFIILQCELIWMAKPKDSCLRKSFRLAADQSPQACLYYDI